MIVLFTAFVCDADKSHTLLSRFLRQFVSVEILNSLGGLYHE